MTFHSTLWAAAALGFVLLLALALGRAARMTRLARPRPDARLRMGESLAIDPRRRLVLVECDGRPLLLLTGPQDQVIGWLP